MEEKKRTHVSEIKKKKVKELAEQMKKKTVMVVSVKCLPSAQFQHIKKKLRNIAKIQMAKKRLVDFALDHCGIKELHKLVPYVEDSTAMLFSEDDAFDISLRLSEEKSSAKAKAGQEAPEDLIVYAGPTDLLPGPDISALSAVGLQPKVEGGKISIVKDKVLCVKGEVISPKKASILAKLNIVPFKIGLEPIAAYTDGKIYLDIKINREKLIKEIEEDYGRSLAFGVEINYVCKETLDYILGKAGLYKKIVESLLNQNQTK